MILVDVRYIVWVRTLIEWSDEKMNRGEGEQLGSTHTSSSASSFSLSYKNGWLVFKVEQATHIYTVVVSESSVAEEMSNARGRRIHPH